jgi:hypothetical protein
MTPRLRKIWNECVKLGHTQLPIPRIESEQLHLVHSFAYLKSSIKYMCHQIYRSETFHLPTECIRDILEYDS